AVVEDAYDVPVEIAVVPAEAFIDREPVLLTRARSLMASLPVRDIDVLIVQETGKNISGYGMDPNITGRYLSPHVTGGPPDRRIVYIRNTLALGEVAVSTALVPHLEPHARTISKPFALEWSGDGSLTPPLAIAPVGARPVWGDF